MDCGAHSLVAEYNSEQRRLIEEFLSCSARDESRTLWMRFKLEQHAHMQRQWVLADYSHIKAVEHFNGASQNKKLQWLGTGPGRMWEPDTDMTLPDWVGMIPVDTKHRLIARPPMRCIACDVSRSHAPYAHCNVVGKFASPMHPMNKMLCGTYHPISATEPAQRHLLEKYRMMVQTVKQHRDATGLNRSASYAPVWLAVRNMTGTPYVVHMTDIVWGIRSAAPRGRIHPSDPSRHESPRKRRKTSSSSPTTPDHQIMPMAMRINL